MSRYFAYLIIINMVVNVLLYVPNILIQYRLEGAVSATALSIFLGSALLYIFVKSMDKFPGYTLGEILESLYPKAIVSGVLPLLAFLWFTAGLITVVSFTLINIQFINPDIPPVPSLVLFLVFLGFIIQLPSNKILYIIEILVIFTFPFIAFVFYKAISSDYLEWDPILIVLKTWNEPPSLYSIAAASYTLTGYTNMVIFNKLIRNKVKMMHIAILLPVSAVNLFATFLVPIGFHGVEGVGTVNYPWMATADSIQMAYGFVERMIYPFLLVTMVISSASVVIHWHVGKELLLHLVSEKHKVLFSTIIIVVFSAVSLGWLQFGNEYIFFQFGKQWLLVRFFAEIALVGLVLSASLRRKKHCANNSEEMA